MMRYYGLVDTLPMSAKNVDTEPTGYVALVRDFIEFWRDVFSL